MDGIREQLVIKQKDTGDIMKKGLIIGAAFILGAILMTVFMRLGVIFVGIILALVALWGGLQIASLFNIEYEYGIYGSEMQIDKIYNKKMRKKFCELDLKKATGFYKGERETDRSEISACGEGDRYSIEYDDQKYGKAVLIFTPDDKTLEAITPYLPRLS